MNRTAVLLVVSTIIAFILSGCATTDPGSVDTRTSPESALTPEKSQRAESQSSDDDSSDTSALVAESKTAPADKKPGVELRYLPERSERRLANGVLDSFVVRSYLPGSVDLERELTFVNEGEVRRTRLYEYGENGRVTVLVGDEGGSIESKTVRTYDDARRLLKEVQLTAEDEMVLSASYHYKGEFIGRWELNDRSGALVSYSVYDYDGDRLSRISNYGASGKLEEYLLYRYDRDGKLLSETTLDVIDDSEIAKVTYRYGDSDLPSEEILTSPGLYRATRYTYDDHGSVVLEEVFGRGNAPLFVTVHRYIAVEVASGR